MIFFVNIICFRNISNCFLNFSMNGAKTLIEFVMFFIAFFRKILSHSFDFFCGLISFKLQFDSIWVNFIKKLSVVN